ncbi:MAG: hypothetical protein IJ776_05755 [Paludibacteraceae bacterium]|nr:hypothetical protein [Paludibacteraceae bacterium]
MKKITSILCALMVLLSANAAPQVKTNSVNKVAELAKVEKQQLANPTKQNVKLQKQARFAAPSTVVAPAKAPKATLATVDLTISTGVKLIDYVSDGGWWQITAENDSYYITLSNDGTVTQVAGTWDVASLDASYSFIQDADNNKITLSSGSVTITFTDTYGSFSVVGSFVGSDGNTYNINLTYTAEKFQLIGKAVVTATYLAMFQSATEQVDTLNVYESEDTKGIYKIDNALSAAGDPIVIYAQDPELVYILPTELAYYSSSYGYVMLTSQGGRYLDAGYSTDVIIANLGDGANVWGKKVKNIISFTADAIKAGLSAYNGGTWFAGQRFIVELPDLETPTITAVNESYIGAESAIVEIVANDDADNVDDMTFTVKNGATTLVDAGKTTDGKLTISGLTKSTTYNLTITAIDRSGKTSEPFAFTFTTVATSDTTAPTLTKAELKEVSDKWAAISVEATDDVTAAAELVYVVTFADETSVNLTAVEGVITLTGLTPQTAYTVTVAAQDAATNKSVAKTVSFTTLELIPIVMNIDWIQAQYYSGYSSAGAYDFEIAYWEGDDNYVIFDTYTKKNNAISGTWSTADGTINAGYSNIKYNGATIKVVSATQTLVFVSLDASTNQATYNASFEAMGDDGNLYKGAFTTEVLTFAKSGDNSSYVSMAGELPDTTAPTLTAGNPLYTLGADLTSVTIRVRATDNETATASIKVELQQENGTKVADFTYASNQFSATVADLTVNTEYTFYIAAEDEAGNKTAAADRLKVTFKTADEEAPTFSGSITVQAKTATTATLRVAARDNATPVGELTLYAALDEAGEQKISENFEVGTKSSTLAYYSGTATGLKPSTTYTLYVIAVDKAGNKAAKSVEVTTEAAANEAPVIGDITATPTVDGAVVTIAVTDDNTAVADLDVTIQDADQLEVTPYPAYNAASGLFETTITGLEAGTQYTFTVLAFDEAYKYSTKQFTFTTTGTESALDNIKNMVKAVKVIENGQIFIIRDGSRFNVLGTKVNE